MVCHTPFNTEFNSVIGSNELISQISAVYEIVKILTIGFRDRGSLFDSYDIKTDTGIDKLYILPILLK